VNSILDDGFSQAAEQHLSDSLSTTPAQRWEWLMEAMQSTWSLAQFRAKRGEITLGPHGEMLWSPQQQAEWERVILATSR
jgi:hypothetical protein